jgi:phosphoribosylformimino-5-aminoimidazole carboxamide ribotide isomerase
MMMRIQVIITSFLFPNGSFSLDRLKETLDILDGDTSKLVIDLSCRAKDGKWFVAMNKWQTITDFEVNQGMSATSQFLARNFLQSKRMHLTRGNREYQITRRALL